MGRRKFTNPWKIFDETDLSTDQVSVWADVSQYDAIMFLVDWTGTADGELKVEISNDKDVVHELNFGEVVPIDSSITPKQHQILINTIAQKFMRLKYVASSGTGTMTSSIVMTSKGA